MLRHRFTGRARGARKPQKGMVGKVRCGWTGTRGERRRNHRFRPAGIWAARQARFWALALALAVGTVWSAADADEEAALSPGTGPRHAIAMHGAPLYDPQFSRFAYTDPNALRGGELVIGELGTFDSLNPFIVKGTSPMAQLETGYLAVQLHTIESLMVRGQDEPFTLYGLLARSVEVPEDRSWVAFTMRPEARFADGTPVRVEDVIFSFETLRDHGRPNMRRYYSLVERTDRLGDDTVRFVFSPEANQEMPLIMGLMPVLSRAYYQNRDFEKTTLEPPLGSGPYILTRVDPGRSLTFERNPDYWGADLAVNRDQNNFDVIRYDFYRDSAALFEAFKTGAVTVRFERDAKLWATGYDFLATRNGQVLRQEIPHGRPADMYGFVFNTRRDIFQDRRVREALLLLFDFEWMNTNFFYGAYTRVQSYFDNSDLSSHNRPAAGLEAALLKPYVDEIPQEILERGWQAPVGGDPAKVRANKLKAMALLNEAGWQVQDGKLVKDGGIPFAFEIMLREPQEVRIAQTFAKALEGLGIEVSIRTVDSAQYHARRSTYDFDMTAFKWRGTLSPGNEQAFRFGSKEADIEGTFNLAGVKSAAVDAMIEAVTQARTREELVAAARALDRLLLAGTYVIPFFYTPVDRIAYWSELQIPPRTPLTGPKIQTWWMLPDN